MTEEQNAPNFNGENPEQAARKKGVGGKVLKYFFLSALVLSAVGFLMTYEGPKYKPPEDENALPPEQLAAISKAAEDKENLAILEGVNTNTNMQSKQLDPNKLVTEDIKIGGGEGVKSGDKVQVNYIGTLLDGTKFDSSYDRGQPFSFTVGAGQVIAGWEQGLVGMKAGGKRKLIVPPQLGYGAEGVPGAIPSNAFLVFEIELLKISSF